jgi:LruC domain-containing protein
VKHSKALSFLAGLAALGLAGSAFEPRASAAPAVTPKMFVDGFVPVPTSLVKTLGSLLPESVPVAGTLLSDVYDPNLVVLEPAKVTVTFVREGAGYANAFGYFTYTSDQGKITITSRQLVFPWVKGTSAGGPLTAGDTVTLRDANGVPVVFPVGTHIGFFVVANGWTGSAVAGWSPLSPTLPSSSSSGNVSTAQGVITTLDAINPEVSLGRPDVARHYVPLRFDGIPGFLDGGPFHIVGIEDLRRDRGGDNDFNDLIFLVQSSPEHAIESVSSIPVDSMSADPDGDGVKGLSDAFPHDAQRAFAVRSPPSGYQAIAFEDTYPFVGDMDYNDAILEYAYDEVLRADGKLKELMGTYHLLARGAGFDHRFGVALHGVPASVSGTLRRQCFSSAGVESDPPDLSLGELLHDDVDGGLSLRIPVFDDTRAAMKETNTASATPVAAPASCRFVAVFDAPLVASAFGAMPFDPYLEVLRDDGLHDVHLPGSLPFADRPEGLPIESGPSSFVDPHGYPWALLVPYDFRYPLERKRIDEKVGGAAPYAQFSAWRTSRGAQSTTWYQTPTVSAQKPLVSAATPETALVRSWAISAGDASP